LNFINNFTTLTKSLKCNSLSSHLKKRIGCDKSYFKRIKRLLGIVKLRVWEKITLHFIALRFRSDLIDLIEPNRKRILSYVEDSANEDRTKHVLSLSKGWPENEMRECKVIFSRTLSHRQT